MYRHDYVCLLYKHGICQNLARTNQPRISRNHRPNTISSPTPNHHSNHRTSLSCRNNNCRKLKIHNRLQTSPSIQPRRPRSCDRTLYYKHSGNMVGRKHCTPPLNTNCRVFSSKKDSQIRISNRLHHSLDNRHHHKNNTSRRSYLYHTSHTRTIYLMATHIHGNHNAHRTNHYPAHKITTNYLRYYCRPIIHHSV